MPGKDLRQENFLRKCKKSFTLSKKIVIMKMSRKLIECVRYETGRMTDLQSYN